MIKNSITPILYGFLLLFQPLTASAAVVADACEIVIHEEGTQFTGSDWQGSFSTGGLCTRGSTCLSNKKCPEFIKIYRVSDSELYLSFFHEEAGPAVNNFYTKNALSVSDFTVPGVPDDLTDFHLLAPTTCDSPTWHGGGQYGYLRSMEIDLSKGVILDKTDYDKLRQQRAEMTDHKNDCAEDGSSSDNLNNPASTAAITATAEQGVSLSSSNIILFVAVTSFLIGALVYILKLRKPDK